MTPDRDSCLGRCRRSLRKQCLPRQVSTQTQVAGLQRQAAWKFRCADQDISVVALLYNGFMKFSPVYIDFRLAWHIANAG